MRSCDEIVELLSASLDGELSADEQTALDEHIAHCPACSALLDDLRALHTAAAEWEEVPAPAGFADAVMSAIAAETAPEKPDNVIPFPAPKKAKRNYWKKWGVSAAAIAIVVLGAVSAPSLMGNFAHKNAAPESADMAYARNDSAAELVLDMEMPQASAYAQSITEDALDTVAEEKSTAKEERPAESAPGAEANVTTSSPHTPGTMPVPPEEAEVDRYVGVLVLEGPLEMLEEYEGAACSDGTVTYIVSADVFAAVYQQLENEKPVGYVYTAGNPGASHGKILVQSN